MDDTEFQSWCNRYGVTKSPGTPAPAADSRYKNYRRQSSDAAPPTRQGGASGRHIKKRLLSGKLGYDAKIDLHGLCQINAKQTLQRFIKAKSASAAICVLVIHGKGHNSPSGKAVLKTLVPGWLKDMPEVAGFRPAQPRHGGDGALYVALKSKGD